MKLIRSIVGMRLRSLRKGVVFFGCLVMSTSFWNPQISFAYIYNIKRADVSTTVMFYMNGDNDLTDEVLSAIDRMETVGSSARLNVIALVDGHPFGISRFGKKWVGTHLLQITQDDQQAQINSRVLADWGEQDLGDPDVLARFIRASIDLFPAERYIFCAFAHGKGVIDTGNLTGSPRGKTLSISTDATSRTIMSLPAFEKALRTGLNGRRLSLMVLFSCLSSMVEIGYALGGVTDYLVASEDEIRLVNDPPGTHQLRGIPFEDLLRHLRGDPAIADIELGRLMINRFIEPYTQEVGAVGPGGSEVFGRYPAGLALIDCRSIGRLAASLDELAAKLIKDLNRPETFLPTLAALQTALSRTQRFKSFLNLEYYDLLDWLDNLARASNSDDVRRMCISSATILQTVVIKFERHTRGVKSNGMSVFFGHHLVPDNVYTAHLAMYRQTRFGQQTRWDELIGTYRDRMQLHRSDLLVYRCRLAYQNREMESFKRLSKKTYGVLFRQVQEGQVEGARKYLAFIDTLPTGVLSTQFIEEIKKLIPSDTNSRLPVSLP